MEMDIMTRTENTEAMEKSSCIKDKCLFFESYSEAAYDGCMYGASGIDDEKNKGCMRKKEKTE